jgi:hypothetical protein
VNELLLNFSVFCQKPVALHYALFSDSEAWQRIGVTYKANCLVPQFLALSLTCTRKKYFDVFCGVTNMDEFAWSVDAREGEAGQSAAWRR